MHVPKRGVDILTRAECLDLLSRSTFGRVGASIDALPVILPVHYGLWGHSVLFRTVPGTKFDAATNGAVVAFQVDQHEPHVDTAWSVLLQGIASKITDPTEAAEARTVPIKSWEGDDGADRLVRIDIFQVSGRRFHRPEDIPFDPATDLPGPA